MDYSNKVVACEKDLHKMIDEGRKVQDQLRLSLDNENNQMLSAEERHKYTTTNDELRLELQIRGENISNYVANTRFKLSDEWSRRGEDLMSKIRGVMDARAKKQGYAMVLDRTALSMTGYPTVLYASGENDLTEALIKELNSTAPTPPAPRQKAPPTTRVAPNLRRNKGRTYGGKSVGWLVLTPALSFILLRRAYGGQGRGRMVYRLTEWRRLAISFVQDEISEQSRDGSATLGGLRSAEEEGRC